MEREIKLKVSIVGLILRIIGKKYTTSMQRFCLDEFRKHFEITRKAWENGDYKIVDEFFELYT